MKATKYIAAIALLLGLVACQPNDLFNGGSKADAEMVEVTFSVQFPEPIPVATKASMGETPTLTDFQDKIYLCLFGSGDGAFQNWIKATDVTLRTEDGKTTGKFKALLPLTDDGRTVHIFVDPPAGYTPGASDYIDLVMENMVKADGEGAYWQEIKLPHGIYASPTDGTKAHQDIIDAFTGVQLLRNFAKIVVDAALLAERRKDGRLEALVVTGCLGQRYKDEIQKEIPEACREILRPLLRASGILI